MYCKVFINLVGIVFSEKNENGFSRLELPENKVDILSLTDALRNLESEVNYWVSDVDGAIFKKFSKVHTVIEAAGGLVCNENNDLLVIHRLNTWDLPKGKIEIGESPEAGALREVEEETGITNISISDMLSDTYHTYTLGDKHILKRTFWFEMRVSGVPNLTPQTEENIAEARWANKAAVEKMAHETYPSLKPLFDAYLLRHK